MLEVKTIEVTPFAQNCRIVWCSKSKSCAVLDPGGDVQRINTQLQQLGLQCSQIWLTHSHLDHCGGVAALKSSSEPKLFAHALERPMRERVEEIAEMYGLPKALMQNCPEPEVSIAGGETLELGELVFETLFTPGHSPGHICFYHEQSDTLLAGDTLFMGSIGRTDLPGGEHQTLIRSIKDVLLSLPDETKVLSGHGPDTTIGAERATNPFIV